MFRPIGIYRIQVLFTFMRLRMRMKEGEVKLQILSIYFFLFNISFCYIAYVTSFTSFALCL